MRCARGVELRDDKRKFYRFEEPIHDTFPHTIELFARPSAAFDLPEGDSYVRLTVERRSFSLGAVAGRRLLPAHSERTPRSSRAFRSWGRTYWSRSRG